MDITKLERCPVCDSDWIDSYISQESIDNGFYEKDSKFFSRVWAIEYTGSDQVKHYQCPDCDSCWDRSGKQIFITPVQLN